ncbi:MAG: hypothetical protein CMI67_04970 [Pelagibaca sp.]|nr:hypothetical protein [Pelagibaca sp.]
MDEKVSQFGMGLAEALETLRGELEAAAKSGREKAMKFRLEDVKLELALVASNKAGAGGGIKWLMLSAEASGEVSEAVTQKLTLTMNVIDEKTNQKAEVSGDSSGPRGAGRIDK